MVTGKIVTWLFAATAFVFGLILVVDVSFPLGCFLVALGFVYVTVAEAKEGFLAWTGFWIPMGLVVWRYVGWYFHLP